MKKALSYSLAVEAPFLSFRDDKETSTISITIDGNDARVAPAATGRKSYFRVMWPLSDLREALSSSPLGVAIRISLEFSEWEPWNQLPTWIGIVSLPRGGKSYELVKRVWQISSSAESLPSALFFDVEGRSRDESLFLCVHFEKLSDELSIGGPALKWDETDRLNIVEAEAEDRRLKVAGWAIHETFPGMAIRLQLLIDGAVRDEVLARSPKLPNGEDVPAGAYAFRMECHLSKSDEGKIAVVRTKEGERQIELAVNELLNGKKSSRSLNANPLPLFVGDGEVIGKVERFDRREVRGWALAPSNPSAAVELILYNDGAAVAQTKTAIHRDDVQAVHGGAGFSGFRFEIPPNLGFEKQGAWDVRPTNGANHIKGRSFSVARPGYFIPSLRSVSCAWSRPKLPDSVTPISAVVLNRNCASLLKELLESAAKHEPSELIEWLIVDHASTDESEDVCNEAVRRGQNVRFLRRNGNFSFSESNNYGASLASHETIVFANNDLVFRGPFIKPILAALSDKSVGVVGVRLLDYIESPNGFDAPIVQHIGVFIKPFSEARAIRPFESRVTSEIPSYQDALLEVPAVTGAMLAMRAVDFVEIGGWDTEYLYGLEDVDLCLRVTTLLNKSVVSEQSVLVNHHRGFSRNKETDVVVRQRNNNNRFNRLWGRLIRRSIRRDVFGKASFWTGVRPTVAFAVVDYGDMTTSGEYYTALELGLALQKIVPCHITFLKEDEWSDLSGVDVLIVMVNKFDIRNVKNINPFLVSINWMRQWFDRWSEDESLYAYDYLFASSTVACEYISGRTGLSVDLLRIAANIEHMDKGKFVREFEADYVLTANKVGTNREIELCLDPESVSGSGAIYGHNWDGTRFEKLSRGPVPYSQIPNVYASANIVLDDANIATKEWGSCNSRVFDSLAAGCLLITNGKSGVAEVFGDLVPTYDSKNSLAEALNYWIENKEERKSRVEELRAIVRSQHNYSERARYLLSSIEAKGRPVRISIKCAARFKERHIWGDYHFANSLARCLRSEGFVVRVDCIEMWNSPLCETDDVVIVLSGRGKYNPIPNQLNLLWIISHPGSISVNDVESYDHVYVASQIHAEFLRGACTRSIDVMLQCSDRYLFPFEEDDAHGSGVPIFVGNSRGVFRQAVRWAAEAEADFDLYGFGWEQFISDSRLKGINIPNDVLGSFYKQARFVLCDHWDDMKRLGYLSNRAFDVLGCGGHLVVDDVAGIEDVLPGGYSVFRSKDDLEAIFAYEKRASIQELRERARWVHEHHSFDARARVFAERIRQELLMPSG